MHWTPPPGVVLLVRDHIGADSPASVEIVLIQAAWNFKGIAEHGLHPCHIPGIREVAPAPWRTASRGTWPFSIPCRNWRHIIGVNLHLHEQVIQDMIPKFAPSLPARWRRLGNHFGHAEDPSWPVCLLCMFMIGSPGSSGRTLFNAAHLCSWPGDSAWATARAPGCHVLGRMPPWNTPGVWPGHPVLSGARAGSGARWSGHDWGSRRARRSSSSAWSCQSARKLFWLVYGVFALSVVWTMLR
jgi:hypothetical protein